MNFPDETTIIIVDAPGLKGIRQRVQQLASRFAKIVSKNNGTVWYIDEPGNIVTVFISPEKPISNLWRWISGPEKTSDEIRHFIPPAGLPFGYHNVGINQWNHFWYRLTLGSRFKKGNGPVILIVANVLGYGWLGRLNETVSIYDCADEISEFKQASLNREAVKAQERKLIGAVDAVVTTSLNLHESKSPGAKKSMLIRNAAEIDHFKKARQKFPRPEDIKNLKKPIVGFYGYLADWLDWELIEYCAKNGAEFDWLYIGPTTRDLSSLEKLDNFHFIGKKPYDDLPQYLSHFSCAHIPFDRTPLTVNVNPVKIYEYLAASVPVVATPLPELELFSDICPVTDDPEKYLASIRQDIAENSEEKSNIRITRVENETWDQRILDYASLITELLT
jgi:glycosyltransferase involved in cell wall biosynthesis